MTVTEARDAFAQSSGYEFEDLMGGSPDDPLTGTNEKGEYLSFFLCDCGRRGFLCCFVAVSGGSG